MVLFAVEDRCGGLHGLDDLRVVFGGAGRKGRRGKEQGARGKGVYFFFSERLRL